MGGNQTIIKYELTNLYHNRLLNITFYAKMASATKRGRINSGKLCSKHPTVKDQVEFFETENILPTTMNCSQCKFLLIKWKVEWNKVYFCCIACKKKISIRNGTFLYKSKIDRSPVPYDVRDWGHLVLTPAMQCDELFAFYIPC